VIRFGCGVDWAFMSTPFDFASESSTGDSTSAIVLQPDTGGGQKIIVGGSSSPSLISQNFGLAQLNADGSFDSIFGNGGKVTTAFPGANAFIKSMALPARRQNCCDGGGILKWRLQPGPGAVFGPVASSQGSFGQRRWERAPNHCRCIRPAQKDNISSANGCKIDHSDTVCDSNARPAARIAVGKKVLSTSPTPTSVVLPPLSACR